MAKKKVVVSTTAKKKKASPTVAKSRKSTVSVPRKKEPLIFGRTNYYMILGGIGLIMLGLFLMSGGSMPSPDVWDESIIYSTRRTVIAPMVIILGIVVSIMAIFYTGKKANSEQPLADG